ncbi:MAG: hypothetical protein POELPBGB_02593 [Bacteroidia bacterium]|nr:hypothetical protein [Bacteroidia bacterium]
MTYAEKLNDERWSSRRNYIIQRDSNKCVCCGKEKTPGISFIKNYEEFIKSSGAIFLEEHIKESSKYITAYTKAEDINIFKEHKLMHLLKLIKNEYYLIENINILGQIPANTRIIDLIFADQENTKSKWLKTKSKVAFLIKFFSPTILHVHHKCYYINREPWDYKDEELTTVCQNCHKNIHINTIIPLYDKNGRNIRDLITCDRCNGAGYFPEFKHVYMGLCFKCSGEGVLLEM